VEHVSRKVGFSVGNTRITDLDYAYDFFSVRREIWIHRCTEGDGGRIRKRSSCLLGDDEDT